MSDSMIIGIKHAHTLLAVVFAAHYLFKSYLFFSGKKETLSKYQSKTKVLLDMITPTLFIITGIILISKIGMGNIGGWFHLKLTIIVLIIPIAIIGFKKENKIMIMIACVMWIYLILLAFLKNPLLFF